MAVVVVRTNDGEEICSWIIDGDPDDWWAVEEAALPGLAEVVAHALRKEQKDD